MIAHSCRGQALVELGIMGSLTLAALALLIQLGLRANYQQEIDQQTFRRALWVAKNEGGEESQAVIVNQYRDRQIPNPSVGFAVMPRTSTQGSAMVTWGEWLTYGTEDPVNQPLMLVHLNDGWKAVRSEELKKVSRFNEEEACREDFFACVRTCNPADSNFAGCRQECQSREETQCAALPLVKEITKTLTTGTAEITQGPGMASRQSTQTTEASTMTLNIKDRNNQLSSTLTSECQFDATAWRCQ